MENDTTEFDQLPLDQRLNLQTGRVYWDELAPHFARGVVLTVDRTVDLIGLAEIMVADDKDKISSLMEIGHLEKTSVQSASKWNDSGQTLWALVVAPWVLVQEERPGEN
ncbi:MAG: DUF2288 family protein [Pseudomonadota bacterium]